MSKNIHQDLYVGLIIIGVSIFLFIKTFGLIEEAAKYPQALLVIFAFFGILIAAGGIKKTKKIRNGEELNYDGDEALLNVKLLKSPLITLGIVIVYVLLLTYIGFFPATILFMAAYLGFMQVKSWKAYVFTIAGLNLFIYLVFVMQLNVQLPAGIFFE
ncbi:tripartite tricarboxylate transporter TctB family protein [Thalassobacillus devorans]|uniref:tripartite tricarboxylate transporter TctB family protein n=1 Tax=Thalassobacillus devorans TaxID=279813 RepID=UPI00048FEE02|nr:tripartite tricarboxylate transporter TctB family protein [Thalassobacillus devorans]